MLFGTIEPDAPRTALRSSYDLVTTVTTTPRQRTRTRLKSVVQAPIVVPFTIGPGETKPVTIRLAVADDGKPQAFVHQWTVRRTDGA